MLDIYAKCKQCQAMRLISSIDIERYEQHTINIDSSMDCARCYEFAIPLLVITKREQEGNQPSYRGYYFVGESGKIAHKEQQS